MKILNLILWFLLATFPLSGQYDANKEKVFHSLEAAMENPLRVYHLDLSDQGLETFPAEILRFENLISLNLAQNNIYNLDGIDFYALKKLEEIYFNNNNFKSFPYEALEKAKNLLVIDFGENELTEISDKINRFRFLEEIILSNNRITKTAKDIKLSFLKTFNIEGNHLDEFPEFVFQSPKLEYLNLYGNNIPAIPKEISINSKLIFLNAGNNPIISIHKEIVLRKLKILILDWINFTNEEVSIDFAGQSTFLEILSLEHCELREIPSIVFNLRRLKELSLMNNKLIEVNDNILNNKKLARLWLSGNEISKKETAMLKQKMQEVEIIDN